MNKININKVFEKCNQMKRVKEIGGPVGYAMRASAVSIIKLSENPEYSMLFANDPNPEAVEHQIEMMMQDSVTDNPHRCVRFEDENPGGCDGCEYRGTISSPALLGITKQESSEFDVKRYAQFLEYVRILSHKINRSLDKTLVIRGTGTKKEPFYILDESVPKVSVELIALPDCNFITFEESVLIDILGGEKNLDVFEKTMRYYNAVVHRGYGNMLDKTNYVSGETMAWVFDAAELNANNKGSTK